MTGLQFRKQKGFVLEIGIKKQPFPGINIIVFGLTNQYDFHHVALENQPIIYCDLSILPFHDNVFSYSLIFNSISINEKPDKFLNEISRICPEGYIDENSALAEFLDSPGPAHQWFIKLEGNELVFIPRKKTNTLEQDLFAKLNKNNFAYRLFLSANPNLFRVKFKWREKIYYRIEKRPFHPNEYAQIIRQTFMQFAGNRIARIFEWFLNLYFKLIYMNRKAVDLKKIIRCPRCENKVVIEFEKVVCKNCNGFYPRKGNVFFLSREYFQRGY